jgi:hypothetical protein
MNAFTLSTVATKFLAKSGKRGLANHDQEPHAVMHNSGEFVRFVPDAGIVANGNPSFSATSLQPDVVGAIGRK